MKVVGVSALAVQLFLWTPSASQAFVVGFLPSITSLIRRASSTSEIPLLFAATDEPKNEVLGGRVEEEPKCLIGRRSLLTLPFQATLIEQILSCSPAKAASDGFLPSTMIQGTADVNDLLEDNGFLPGFYGIIPAISLEQKLYELSQRLPKRPSNPVKLQNNPGGGDCAFYSIVISLVHENLGVTIRYPNHLERLRYASWDLRQKAVRRLSQQDLPIYLWGNEYMGTGQLLEAAAHHHGLSALEYLGWMEQPHVWGGGPEFVALSNVLEQPIHIYNLVSMTDGSFALDRVAACGSPRWDDKQALHVLCGDGRFPNIEPGEELRVGDHFWTVFPDWESTEI